MPPDIDFDLTPTPDSPSTGVSEDGQDPSQVYPLVEDTGIADGAVDRLLEQFCEKPRIEALIRLLAAEAQELEAAIWDLMLARCLPNASGKILDDLGLLVDEGRNALSDADYKLAIAQKVRILRSNGTSPDILGILFAELGDTFDLEVTTDSGGRFHVRLNDAVTVVEAERALTLIQLSKAAGIGSEVQFFLAPEATVFRCSSLSGTLQTSATQGFADSAQTTGGRLAGVIE